MIGDRRLPDPTDDDDADDGDARVEAFEEALVAELRDWFPELRRVFEDSLRGYVREIEALSMKHGLTTAKQIRRLAVYHMGARLYLRGIPEWFTTLLSTRDMPPSVRIRLLGLRLEKEIDELEEE